MQEKGWTILELTVEPDHVHLFVRAWPITISAEIIKECKGLTSHEYFNRNLSAVDASMNASTRRQSCRSGISCVVHVR